MAGAKPKFLDRNEVRSAAGFALCMFVLLFTELLVNDRGAALFGGEDVNMIYALSATSTAAGYLIFPLVSLLTAQERKRLIFFICCAAVFLAASAALLQLFYGK